MPRSVDLRCHPATPCPALDGISVAVSGERDSGITLVYRLHGRLTQIVVPTVLPAAATQSAVDGLWQHTCCEAFIGQVGAPAYDEYNLSPSGQWAAYAFSDYRQRRPATLTAPRFSVRHDQAELLLTATLAPLAADMTAGNPAWELALSAVIESSDGSRSYWALAHPPGQPDFHRRSAFILKL